MVPMSTMNAANMLNTLLMFLPIFCLSCAVPTVLLAVLEYFLARMESPWPGRVLPILSAVHALGWTLVLLLNMSTMLHPSLYFLPLAVLVIFNIPTLIFFLIYRNTRKKFTERRAMDRKDIQDL